MIIIEFLIFSSFPSVFKYIIPKLDSSGITYDVLDGKTPKDERVSKVNEFNQSDKTKVFLISLKVGGSGLNLPGADMVIHYDPWWNIAATNQATDRAYRFGQTKEVHVIKLIVKKTQLRKRFWPYSKRRLS
ncbi:MAG: SWF/SNF helicase family protein [Clostridium sp.]|nr:MAG: SWF/SNF helicase family protein [Clostridium sp.]